MRVKALKRCEHYYSATANQLGDGALFKDVLFDTDTDASMTLLDYA